MTRWNISRSFFRATLSDFIEAAAGLKEDAEAVSGKTFNLKVVFYKAAQKNTLLENEQISGMWLTKNPDARVFSEASDLKKIDQNAWDQADYVQVVLSSSLPGLSGTMEAKGWDHKGFNFQMGPEDTGRKVMSRFLNNRFIIWNRGIDLRGARNTPL